MSARFDLTSFDDRFFAIRRANRMHCVGRISGTELLDANPDCAEVFEAVETLVVGESVTLGGGAFAATTLVRVA
ncbi:MAG: hypothetical protein WCE44_02730 [Candidatus Velthaea sp.]